MSTVAGRRTTRRTRTRPIISYAESSDSELEPYNDDSSELEFEYQPKITSRPQKRLFKRHRRSAPRRTRSQICEKRRLPKRRKQKSNSQLESSTDDYAISAQSSIVPPWQTLPYHILVQIFQFASHPLYEENTFEPLPSGRWLVSVARLCRAFAEPAFTVLYSSLPMVPIVQANMLVDLLKADPISLAFKYRQKVVSLQIEVGQVVTNISRKSGYLDLYGLIRDLPRLRDLEFYHQKDMSPYRDLDVPIKWTYPESIFEALEYVDPIADSHRGDKTSICKLRSWRWSSRLAGKKWPLERLIQVHKKPSFRSLRKIAFVNYQTPTLKADEEDPDYESILAEALNALPTLEHVIFESSTLLNFKLLPLLPKNLWNIELINCWEITSENFSDFLITHGQQLRYLTLNHNQSLNLAFLTILGPSCPELQVLRMSMNYFNIHTSYRDSEPMYDYLLLPDQVPVWPKKLQTIELTHLRKWVTKAAEIFFSSLLDSAADLCDLRRLCIQAILNVGWRDRATFRDKWVGSINRVFKRNSETLTPVNTISSTTPILSKTVLTDIDEPSLSMSIESSSLNTPESVKYKAELNDTPPRRSCRATVRAIPSGKYFESSEDSGSESIGSSFKDKLSPSMKMRRCLIRELNILRATGGIDLSTTISSPPETPSSEFDSHMGIVINSNNTCKQNQFIQGMCESVEIRIDNLRPAENQVTEADFLDVEISGDEDWNSEGDEGQWAFEGIDHIH